MFTKKKGFTLLELMIVIGVISVLFAVTMKFGSSRVDDLDTQTVKEEFGNIYHQTISQTLVSNYFQQKKYAIMTIKFSSGSQGFDYILSGETNDFFSGFSSKKIVITSLFLENTPVSELYLSFSPYHIGCSLFSDIKTGSIAYVYINFGSRQKLSCYRLQSSLCTLIEETCPASL